MKGNIWHMTGFVAHSGNGVTACEGIDNQSAGVARPARR
jgi:hypothetical protein